MIPLGHHLKRTTLLLTLIALLAQYLPATNHAAASAAPFLMAYIHAKTNYSELVRATNGALHEVSLDWLGISAEGKLLIDEKKYNPAFIEEMHAQGVRVVPMLSNGFDRQIGITALNNAETLTDDIVAMVNQRNFDGINYDIENLSENEYYAQTRFVKMLRDKMPDKVLAVAVAANPYRWSKGWHASYDMAGLAEAADYLMLMAYDDGYSGGPEKPVASITFVENCIKDLLERGVPPEKIVLGIPLYGRLWSADGTQLGLGVELTSANKMVTDPALIDKVITYDETAQTAKMTFTATAPYPIYSWKNIPAGQYTMWYENDRSLQAKIALMHKYGLKGLGHWSLGQAEGSIWNLIVPWSQGRFYTDLQDHWAEEPVNYAISRGWLNWVNESDFLPEQPMYRDQVATALQSFFHLDAVAVKDRRAFNDVDESQWAYQSIQAVVYQGMMGGMNTELALFGPMEQFTRAQFASIFDRLITAAEDQAKKPIQWEKLQSPYEDLPYEHWARVPLLRMVERGLLAGYDEEGTKLLKPDQPISRSEMAVLLQRMESWFTIDNKTGKGWQVQLP